MKLNMFYPPMGSEKCFEFDDIMLQPFFDKRISQEVTGDCLGDMFKGYVFRISGGNDKQGFAMKQGILVNHRVRLLLSAGSSGYRPRRDGERRRKSVRGCIVGPDLSVLNLVVIKQGEKPIPGLTDSESAVPRRRGPKRASKIRKLFHLSKKDDVKKYVVRREFVNKKGKKIDKAPKIQRLITPLRLQRKRARALEIKNAQVKAKLEAAEYHKLLSQKAKELKARRSSSIAKRLSHLQAKKADPKVEKEVVEKKVEKKEKNAQPKMEKEKKVEQKPAADKKQAQKAAPAKATEKKQPAKEAPKDSKKAVQKPGGKVVPKLESKATEKAVPKEKALAKKEVKPTSQKTQPKAAQPKPQAQTKPTQEKTQPAKPAAPKPQAKPAEKPAQKQQQQKKPAAKSAPKK